MSTVESGLSRTATLCWLLGSWLLANGLTHLLVWFTTGGIYYQLPPAGSLAAEASIDLLNFIIPLLVMRWRFRETSIVAATGWRWTGARVVYWALAGFLLFMAVSILTNHLFRNQMIEYAPAASSPLTQGDLRMLTLMLLFLPAAGEEMMFRGFLQGYCTRLYGSVVGILLPAVLFAARHHPSDVYFGRLHHASAAAWANRFVQLYLGALILGFVRLKARSTWASWLVHTGTLALIIVLGQLWKAFVP
jgi:membrane protease YdiL (CAAX protease family)